MLVPELVIVATALVLLALEPERVRLSRLPEFKPVVLEERFRPYPEVNELAVIEAALVVVPVKVCMYLPVPEFRVRSWLAAKVTPLEAVIRPEMVGVAVQEVGETVRPEPAMVVVYEAWPKVTAAELP